MKAKKSLGQHFLTSKSAVFSMIEAGELKENELVVEIGPGKGVLTEKLLKKANVLAIEKDTDMISLLEEKFQKEIEAKKLKILQMDVLDFNTGDIGDYKLIANIPYYITGEILRKFLENKNKPKIAVLLVQKEVAERIIAKNDKESILSLSVKFFGKPQILKIVKAGSFNPKPKVDSAILKISQISKESPKNMDIFFKLVKLGFSHKRKKLSGNLLSLYSKNQIALAFEKLGIDLNSRAEDLKIDDWQKLSEPL